MKLELYKTARGGYATTIDGGYPVVYYTHDGLTICARCAGLETDDTQAVIAAEPYYEGPDLLCEDCQKTVIQSAYGDLNNGGE